MSKQTVYNDAYRDLRIEEIEIELAQAFQLKRLFLNHSLHKTSGLQRPRLQIDVIDLHAPQKALKLGLVALVQMRLAYFFAHEADISVGAIIRNPEDILPKSLIQPIPPHRRLPPPTARK